MAMVPREPDVRVGSRAVEVDSVGRWRRYWPVKMVVPPTAGARRQFGYLAGAPALAEPKNRGATGENLLSKKG